MDATLPIRLVIADDHPATLLGLGLMLNSNPDFSILASARDGQETLQAVRQLRPDILLLDISMPVCDGFTVLEKLHTEGTVCKTVLYNYQLDENRILEAIEWGVRGFVLKTMSPLLLLQALHKVHAGEKWLEMGAANRLLEREATQQRLGDLLTAREIELIKVVAEGLRSQAIADRLHIKEGTVRIHLNNIYKKLGLSGRGALIAFAQQNGLS